MSNVKRKLTMFLAVIILTGGAHVLASNSASVKEDTTALEKEMKTNNLVITGKDTIMYDGSAVTFNNKNGNFQYQGDGMPVWYQLKKEGMEKGKLSDNYIRVRNVPTDAGKYAMAVYNDKIREYSKPFYFEIAKAPLELKWPERVCKIYNDTPYFNMRLKSMGGLVGDDENNPNIEFRVRVIAENKNVGVHKVAKIERFAGSVDLHNYEFKENAPTEVEILSSDTVLPEELAKPGNLSKISLSGINKTEDSNFNLTMNKIQQCEAKQTIKYIFENILKKTPLKNMDLDSMTESEKKTYITEKNIVQAVKRDAYINVYVETKDKECHVAKKDERKIEAVLDREEKVLKMVDIKISIKSVEQNGLVCQLGELIDLDEKLQFSMNMPDNIKGEKFKVVRILDGNVEFLPAKDVCYNRDQNEVVFQLDKGGIYGIVQL